RLQRDTPRTPIRKSYDSVATSALTAGLLLIYCKPVDRMLTSYFKQLTTLDLREACGEASWRQTSKTTGPFSGVSRLQNETSSGRTFSSVLREKQTGYTC